MDLTLSAAGLVSSLRTMFKSTHCIVSQISTICADRVTIVNVVTVTIYRDHVGDYLFFSIDSVHLNFEFCL